MSDRAGLNGLITGQTISVRFACSGQVAKVNISPGSRVNRQQILASLNRYPFQLELDKELKDFERIRADFEIFHKKLGNDQSELARYEKIRQQSLLDVSVKAVELAKFRLDQADLISPIEGLVLADGGLRSGMYITPGANPVDILDFSTLAFSLKINWADLEKFQSNSEYFVKLTTVAEKIPARVLPFIPSADPQKPPIIRFRLDTQHTLYPGLSGELYPAD